MQLTLSMAELISERGNVCQSHSAPLLGRPGKALETSPASSSETLNTLSSPKKRRTIGANLPHVKPFHHITSSPQSLPALSPYAPSSPSSTPVKPVASQCATSQLELPSIQCHVQPSVANPPALPLLDLSSLPSVADLSACAPHTARASVDAITTSLSAVRSYLFIGSQASISISRSTTHCHSLTPSRPIHVISFATSTTPQVERCNDPRRVQSNGYPLPSHALRKSAGVPFLNGDRRLVQSDDSLNIVSFSAFPIRDDVHQRIDHVFLPVALAVDCARAAGEAAALVCAQGISRSGACAVAYLMLSEGLSVDDALTETRGARPIVAPNSAFMAALSRLEHRQRNGRDKDMWTVLRPTVNNPTSSHGSSDARRHALRAAFYGGERTSHNGEEVRKIVPFVAEELCHHGRVCRDDVVLVERAWRGGVDVWCAPEASTEKIEAAVRLARRIALQETRDIARFAGPSVSPGRVCIVHAGENSSFDNEVYSVVSMDIRR